MKMKTLVLFSLILTVALGMPPPPMQKQPMLKKVYQKHVVDLVHGLVLPDQLWPSVKQEDKKQLKAPEVVKDQEEIEVKPEVKVEAKGEEKMKQAEEGKQDIKPQLGGEVELEKGDSGTEFFIMPEPEVNIQPEEVKKELKPEDKAMFEDELQNKLKKVKQEAKEQPLQVFIPEPDVVANEPHLKFMDEPLKLLEEVYLNKKNKMKKKKKMRMELEAEGPEETKTGEQGDLLSGPFPNRKGE